MVAGYEILGEIARGGMGVVYRARDSRMGRDVAIKVLSKAEPQALARFEREAAVLASFRHPNIVAIHAAGTEQATPYLVMELVEGESLGARLHREGSLPEPEALRICALLARALQEVHDHEILHRDVKPENVLLRDGQPILGDFGLAKDLSGDQRLTRTGAFLGTPGFAAPEQAMGDKPRMGPATDVYGLGATLYCLLTGVSPFEGKDGTELLASMHQGADPPSSVKAGLGPRVDTLCLNCLAPDPDDRYPTAEALADDLDRLLAGDSLTFESGFSAGGAARANQRRGALLAALLAVVVIALASVAAWVANPLSATLPDPAVPGEETALGDAPSGQAQAAEAREVAKARKLLGERRRLEALDVCDALTDAPPDLVWDAALLEVEANLRAESPELGVRVLQRPSVERLRAAGDDTLLARRRTLAERSVDQAITRGKVLLELVKTPDDPKVLTRQSAQLRIAVLLASDYRMSADLAHRSLVGSPLYMRSKPELRHPAIDWALTIAELAPEDARVQADVGALGGMTFTVESTRFIPPLRRALRLNPPGTKLHRQLSKTLWEALFQDDPRDPQLTVLTDRLLNDPQATLHQRYLVLAGRADLLSYEGRYQDALRDVDMGLRGEPGRFEWLARRASLLWHLNEREEALALAWDLLEGVDYEKTQRTSKGDIISATLTACDRVCRVVWSGARQVDTLRVHQELERLITAVFKGNPTDVRLGAWLLAKSWCELELGRHDQATKTFGANARFYARYARNAALPGLPVPERVRRSKRYERLARLVARDSAAVTRELEGRLVDRLKVHPSFREFEDQPEPR